VQQTLQNKRTHWCVVSVDESVLQFSFMWFPLLRALHELQFDSLIHPAPAQRQPATPNFSLFFVLEFYLVITSAKTVTKNHV